MKDKLIFEPLTESQVKDKCRDFYTDLSARFQGDYLIALKEHTFLAGGFIRSLLDGTELNDADVYFTNPGTAYWFTSRIYVPLKVKTKNAVTLAIPGRIERVQGTTKQYPSYESFAVQLIVRDSGGPEQVVKAFDFTNCMSFYDPSTDTLVISDEAKQSIASKQLVFNVNSITYPAAVLKRASKFFHHGYNISVAEHAKMLYKITTSPLADFLINSKESY